MKTPPSSRRSVPQWAFWTLAVLLVPAIAFVFGIGAGFSEAHREDGGGAAGDLIGYLPAALLSMAWVGCIAGGVLGMMRQAVAERWSGVLVLIMAFIVVAIMAAFMALLSALLRNAVLETLLRVIFLVTLFGFALVYWRRIDEAAREAQKTAWLWGSALALGGLGAAEPLLLRDDGSLRLALLLGEGSPHDWLLSGALYLLLAQLAAGLLLWGVWWIRAR